MGSFWRQTAVEWEWGGWLWEERLWYSEFDSICQDIRDDTDPNWPNVIWCLLTVFSLEMSDHFLAVFTSLQALPNHSSTFNFSFHYGLAGCLCPCYLLPSFLRNHRQSYYWWTFISRGHSSLWHFTYGSQAVMSEWGARGNPVVCHKHLSVTASGEHEVKPSDAESKKKGVHLWHLNCSCFFGMIPLKSSVNSICRKSDLKG